MVNPPVWKRGRAWFAIVGAVAIAAWTISRLIENSADPGHYYEYFRNPARFVYPTESVITWTCAIAIEAVVAAVCLLVGRAVPTVCVLLAVIFGTAFLAMLPLAMHAAPPFGCHALWLLFAAGWFGFAALATWIAGLAARVRERARWQAEMDNVGRS